MDGYKKHDELVDELIGDMEILASAVMADLIMPGDVVDFGPYGILYVAELSEDGQSAWVSTKQANQGWLISLALAQAIVKKAADPEVEIAVNEDLAERAHDLWIEREQSKGNTDNPNMVPYDELSQEDKESDRDYSRSFFEIIEENGYEVTEKDASLDDYVDKLYDGQELTGAEKQDLKSELLIWKQDHPELAQDISRVESLIEGAGNWIDIATLLEGLL